MGQQVLLPGGVQLAEHIVQQQHRMLAGHLCRHGRLGQLEAEHRAALLALAGKGPRVLAVQLEDQILPVGPGEAAASPQLGRAVGADRLGEARRPFRRLKAGLVVYRKLLAAVADLGIILHRQRGQRREVALPPGGDRRAGLGHLAVEHL